MAQSELEYLTRLPLEEVTADEGGAEVEECLMDIVATFVACVEAAELAEPGNRAFDDQRCRPSRSLRSMPRLAILWMMPRRRRSSRQKR